jgi:hypothetical protein
MIVFYDPVTLIPVHVIYDADQSFLAHHKSLSDHWAETRERIPHEHIGLRKNTDGVIGVYRLETFAIIMPNRFVAGEEAVLSAIPSGAAISIEGEPKGMMDESGVLEFTPHTAGCYTIEFSREGYKTTRYTIEALPSA